jgi:hypothetical protein
MPRGRPPLWSPERIETARKLLLTGMSYEQSAKAMGVSRASLVNSLKRREKLVTRRDIAANKWHPIETAYKTPFDILISDGKYVVIGGWDYKKECWTDILNHRVKPTHWMPLPTPPYH